MNTKKAALLITYSLLTSTPLAGFAQGGNASSASQTTKSASSSKSADRALQKRVRAALAKDKQLNAANITVRARGGAVSLQGSVTSQDEVSRAEEVTKGVSGVTSVTNSLTVRQSGQ
ncbi:BON domain-containing protein [Paraburkholderia phymatum]|uniref:BON domain-containing protein n=1 Tax=Paraburkholderia phymatum TaxID=148447 RepID=A0ACC6TXQ4_9BURK